MTTLIDYKERPLEHSQKVMIIVVSQYSISCFIFLVQIFSY